MHFRPMVLHKRTHDDAAAISTPQGRVPRNAFVSWLLIFYFFADHWAGWLLKVLPAKIQSSLLVFDRNFDDLLVDERRYRLSGTSLLVRILRRCRDGDRLRLGGHQLRRSGLVRPANLRERGEQVRVGPYVISRHLSIAENGKKDIDCIVGKCPAIRRIGRRLARIIREDIRQQNPCGSLCLLRRISTRMLQRVGEHRDETGIVRWLRSLVVGLVVAGKEYRLRGQRASVRLNPFPSHAIHCTLP